MGELEDLAGTLKAMQARLLEFKDRDDVAYQVGELRLDVKDLGTIAHACQDCADARALDPDGGEEA